MSLFNLVEDFKNGDADKFEQIYLETNRLVFYVVSRIVTDHDAVKDIVQDSYVSAYESIDKLIDNNFQTWINRIATNKAKDYLRKRKPMLFSDYQMDDGDDYTFEIEDDNTDFQPEVVSSKRETRKILDGIMSQLSDEQRICIMMFYFDEMTTKEISEDLEVSENSIKSRLRYARMKIKDSVEELEKKGVKLYGLAPLPYFVFLLNEYSKVYKVPFLLGFRFKQQKIKGHKVSNSTRFAVINTASKVIVATSLVTASVVGVSSYVSNKINGDSNKVIEVLHDDLYMVEYGEEFDTKIIQNLYQDYELEFNITPISNNLANLRYNGEIISASILTFEIAENMYSTYLITVDTNQPKMEGPTRFETVVGSIINYKLMVASDVVDGELNIIYGGYVDFNTPGEYNVYAKAVDSNNNEIIKTIKVIVKAQLFEDDEVIDEIPEELPEGLPPVVDATPEDPKEDLHPGNEPEDEIEYPTSTLDFIVDKYFEHRFLGLNGFGRLSSLSSYGNLSLKGRQILDNVVVTIEPIYVHGGNVVWSESNPDITKLRNGDKMLIRYTIPEGLDSSYVEYNEQLHEYVEYKFKSTTELITVSGLSE